MLAVGWNQWKKYQLGRTGSTQSRGTTTARPAQSEGQHGPTSPSPIDIMSGDLFWRAVTRGQVPPPGPAFINRFLHAVPNSWSEEWLEVRPTPLAMSDTRNSIDKLCTEVLDRIGLEGAPQPVIQAAEEAVTMNMTALAVALAGEVLAGLPGDVVTGLDHDGYPGWSQSANENLVAIQMRELASSTDAALHTAADNRFSTRPGDCVRVLVRVLERAADQIQADLIAGEQSDEGYEAVLARQAGNMGLALAVAKEIAAERF